MHAFTEHTGTAVIFDLPNIDTDQIIPKQFLKRIERTGYGEFLFYDRRFDGDGNELPEFVLNDKRYDGASILIAGANFGCGSSREHAPWSLLDFGFRVVIAPGFADIFYNNSLKNGLLPIALDDGTVENIKQIVISDPLSKLEISLVDQRIKLPDGTSVHFSIDAFSRHCLINGLDEIGLTLRHETAIADFERTSAYHAIA